MLDCSVVVAWLVPDERHDATRRLLDRVAEEGALVPGHWRLDIANTLIIAERRDRMSRAQRQAVLAHVASLPISVDDATAEQAWSRTLGFADRFILTVYDAAYLELADRRSIPLATLDNALSGAARAAGVDLVLS